jgi:transketolase
MRLALIETLLDLAAQDDRVCLLTGDLGFTVLERFAAAFPGRFFNVGVAEANLLGLATGLALEGCIPYVYSIATFATMRPYEQVRNGPVIHGLPVRVIGIGGGFAYGHAGITHFGLEDYAIMRAQPGMTVLSPADPAQTRTALRATYAHRGPIYYRIGKGGNAEVRGLGGRFALDRVERLGDGKDALILTTGSITVEVLEAVALLERDGLRCTVGVVATLSPPPAAALAAIMTGFATVTTVEEHYATGGLGSLVAEVIAELGAPVRLRRVAVREVPKGVTGSQRYLWGLTGLSHDQLAEVVRSTARAVTA